MDGVCARAALCSFLIRAGVILLREVTSSVPRPRPRNETPLPIMYSRAYDLRALAESVSRNKSRSLAAAAAAWPGGRAGGGTS